MTKKRVELSQLEGSQNEFNTNRESAGSTCQHPVRRLPPSSAIGLKNSGTKHEFGRTGIRVERNI
jgi:hypothetical protein